YFNLLIKLLFFIRGAFLTLFFKDLIVSFFYFMDPSHKYIYIYIYILSLFIIMNESYRNRTKAFSL
ncbi:MAG: hypothetical protein MCS20_02230, partial [Candidatus Phytoplasma mali]|nr:hypothetical protein [Candidatus Phytoplasma australiense]MCG7202206.1 hypothetical protein [Candidatus Phytoplasma mali]